MTSDPDFLYVFLFHISRNTILVGLPHIRDLRVWQFTPLYGLPDKSMWQLSHYDIGPAKYGQIFHQTGREDMWKAEAMPRK